MCDCVCMYVYRGSVPAMCMVIQSAFASTMGFCPDLLWSPWARATVKRPAAVIIEARMLGCSGYLRAGCVLVGAVRSRISLRKNCCCMKRVVTGSARVKTASVFVQEQDGRTMTCQDAQADGRTRRGVVGVQGRKWQLTLALSKRVRRAVWGTAGQGSSKHAGTSLA